MKSPFRSIRQKLFNEGKLVRYLGYTVGEIALIMIGIMLALELNNWNEDRKAQVEFDLYIAQLKEDVQLAISVVEIRVGRAAFRIQQALTVLDFLKSDVGKLEDLDEIEAAMDGLGRYSIQENKFGYLGQLINGNLDAIIHEKDLSKDVLIMTRVITWRLAGIEEIAVIYKAATTTFTKHQGRTISIVPEMKFSYNLAAIKASEEYFYATQNLIHFLGTASNRYSEIKKALEDFLAVLEEYE